MRSSSYWIREQVHQAIQGLLGASAGPMKKSRTGADGGAGAEVGSASGVQAESLVSREDSILDPAEQQLRSFARGIFWIHRRREGLAHGGE